MKLAVYERSVCKRSRECACSDSGTLPLFCLRRRLHNSRLTLSPVPGDKDIWLRYKSRCMSSTPPVLRPPSEPSPATFLKSLLASRAAEVLGIAAAGGTTHREVAVISEHLGADYHGRFLIELLQNANDQAGAHGATVTIIRELGLLVVANEGEPLNTSGVRSLTSLGMSAKDPNELIGNKGIGFKAVYEVTRSPEIYSAPSRLESFRAGGGFAFRLSMDVFAGPEGEARLKALTSDARESKPRLHAISMKQREPPSRPRFAKPRRSNSRSR
ncbi:MAG: hypothetical protein JWL59_4345 [Chthoniobacteraceae bacterium]|nr:hypothetical protein [Chthoniobacteraceae bacterium]